MSQEILKALKDLSDNLAEFRKESRERDEHLIKTLNAVHTQGSENRTSIARLARLLDALNDKIDPRNPQAASG